METDKNPLRKRNITCLECRVPLHENFDASELSGWCCQTCGRALCPRCEAQPFGEECVICGGKGWITIPKRAYHSHKFYPQ